jgi:hypothetical protein
MKSPRIHNISFKKYTILFCFSICTLFVFPQTKTTKSPKNNNTSQVNSTNKYNSNQTQSLSYPLLHDTCLRKKFSIVFYVILDSSYSSGAINTATLNALVDSINNKFKKICVKFENCSTVFIPNHSYSKWSRTSTEMVVTASWYTDKTLNYYIVDSIKNNPLEANGYTFSPKTPTNLTTPKKDLIVMEKGDIVLNTFAVNPAPTLHQLGHFFGLPHTHDEINPAMPATPPPPTGVVSKEFADGSNCQIHGDGFCDTEADPGPIGTIADGMGNYYIIPKDNYMTYYGTRCRFTQEQYNAMAYYIFTKRLYLH